MDTHTAKQILAEANVDVSDHGTGAVVALAHGAGGGVIENFAPLIGSLPDRRYVGPYYPGAGATPRRGEPLELHDLADFVVAAAVSRGADRFPVIGLSLGAAVAVTAAARHPEHVSALVLTVGLARADVRVRSASATWRALAAAGERSTLAAAILAAASSDTALRALTDDAEQQALAAIAGSMPPGLPDHMELVGRTDVTGLFGSIAVPTVVIAAGEDRLVPPEIGREFAAIAGARLIDYPGAGHIFTPAEAAQWAGDIGAFLTALDGPGELR